MSNKYPALKETGQEPEYQKNPPLVISSVGTDNTRAILHEPPIGSAVCSRSGANLNIWGIKHIIHAAPQAFGSSPNEEQFRKWVVLSGQNSVILAKRVGCRKLAVCFVGSAIYGGNSNREELANAFVKGVVNQAEQEKMEVLFVAHNSETKVWPEPNGKNLNVWFKEAVDKNPSMWNKGIVNYNKFGDLQTHNVDAIVNAANRNCSLSGGGITGALGTAAGSEAGQISAETKALIKEFNDAISGKEKDNENKIITCRAKYKGPKVDLLNGSPCFSFEPQDGNKDQIVVGQKFPIFTDNPPKFDVLYEISLREKEEVGGILKSVEVIKIEEIKKDDKDKETFAEWREELKELDNNIAKAFDKNKVEEWKKEGKVGRAEEVKKLLESVKSNSQFLDLIKIKQSSNSLEDFVADKKPPEVITVIKRFEYDSLNQGDKETKNKKIRKYYSLRENDVLTDKQINEYCYKLAIGQINEKEQDPNNTINPENNILKYFGISALILIPLGLFLAFFIRKRKK